MLGYVLVSGKNELIFVDGCEQFMTRIYSIVDTQFSYTFDAERASSSSGVYTDISKKKSSYKKGKRRNEPSRSLHEISHVLLPLVSFYRAASLNENDAINYISSDFGKIQFKKLDSGHSIICFASEKENPSSLIAYVEESLLRYFGPLVNICHMELLAIKSAKECMKNVFEKYEKRKFCGFLNVRENTFFEEELLSLRQVIKSVSIACEKISGNNRTLLCVDKDIYLSAASSKLNENVKSLSANELNGYIELLPVSTTLFKVTTSQLWIQLKKGGIPYFVNFSQYRMTDRVTITVMHESSNNVLIRYMTFLLRQIKSRSDEPTNSEIREISKTIKEISMLITSQKAIQEESSIAFMRNPSRTASFLQTIWNQAKDTLSAAEESSPDWTFRASRLSVSSLRSAVTFLSMTSALPSKLSLDKTSCKKFDVLMGYLERQVVTIIQELCAISKRTSEKKFLSAVQIVLDDYVTNKLKPNLIDFQNSITQENLKHHLVPSSLRLDMLGYKLTIAELGYSIAHIPDNVKSDLSRYSSQRVSHDFCATIAGESGFMYTFYFIRSSFIMKKKSFNYSFTVIYPHFASSQLANKQINRLLEHLIPHVFKVAQCYE